jgi:PAS domain S-box-containing protein
MDLTGILTAIGYEVLGPVSSGKAALETLTKSKPDLILMDITIKGEINGIETAQKIKESLDIPLIFLTAHSDEKTVQQAELVKPQGYIIKPFDGAELKKTIEIALFKYKLKKNLKNNEAELKQLFESTPLPYESLDENGRFIEINDAWLNLLGYSREEVIGKKFVDFLASDCVPIFEKKFSNFKKAEEIRDMDLKMIHKNGSHISVSYEGLIGYDENGHFKQTHCMFQDMTEKKILNLFKID